MTSASRRQEALTNLQNDLTSDRKQCQDLSEELRLSSTKNLEETLAASELALTKIFKLVVYKQAHRDSIDQAIIQQPAALFAQVISGFNNAADKGKNAFDTMGRIHTKSVDLDSNKIVPLQTMADALQKEISDELNKLQTSIPALVSRVSELESLIISTYTHIKELEDKAKNTERKGGFIDATGYSATRLLPYGASHGYEAEFSALPSLSELYGIQKQADTLRWSVSTWKTQLSKSQTELRTAQTHKAECEHQDSQLRVILAELPAFQAENQRLQDQTTAMERNATKLKSDTNQMLLLARGLRMEADISRELVAAKADFVEAILDLLQFALEYPRFLDEGEMILDGLVYVYDGDFMPGKIKIKVDKLRATLAQLKLIPRG